MKKSLATLLVTLCACYAQAETKFVNVNIQSTNDYKGFIRAEVGVENRLESRFKQTGKCENRQTYPQPTNAKNIAYGEILGVTVMPLKETDGGVKAYLKIESSPAHMKWWEVSTDCEQPLGPGYTNFEGVYETFEWDTTKVIKLPKGLMALVTFSKPDADLK